MSASRVAGRFRRRQNDDGLVEIEAHTVVPDADAAAAWYARAFGAEEESRVPLPDGRALSVSPTRS